MRITVYDVMDYLKAGWHRDRIASLFRLASRDIQAAIDYIEQHREQVDADYQRIVQRHRDLSIFAGGAGTDRHLPRIGSPKA